METLAEIKDAKMDYKVIADVVCEMHIDYGTKKRVKSIIKNSVREGKEKNTPVRVQKLTEISTLKSAKPETC